MPDAEVQLQPDSTGKQIDNTTETTGAGTVYRQRISVAAAGSNNQLGIDATGKISNKVADGDDVAQGATTDAAVSSDAAGTVNAHLRGIVKLLAAGIAVTIAAALDISDRAARLVGHVSLDTGGTLVGQKTGANSVPVVLDSDTDRGQKIMANSLPVAIANDQTNLPENLAAVGGVAVSLGQKTAAASIPVVLDSDTDRGQKAMASSLPVVVASDQSTLSISASSLPLPTGAATEATEATGWETLFNLLRTQNAILRSISYQLSTLGSPSIRIEDLTPFMQDEALQ